MSEPHQVSEPVASLSEWFRRLQMAEGRVAELEAALAAEQEAHERTRQQADEDRHHEHVQADAALARADALVRSVEWSATTITHEAGRNVLASACPRCGRMQHNGHNEVCELAAYLRDREGGAAQKPKEWECVCGHHYNAHRPDNHCQDCDCCGYVDGPASAELEGGAP